MSQLISPATLASRLGDADVVVLDVRWRLDRPDGRDDFAAGHIPGAVYVDLPSELAGHPATPVARGGRHPLPSAEDLQAAARRWGINHGDTVVVYDDLGGMSAARAWWLLRDAGLTDVLVLDGALAGWRAAGLDIASGPTLAPSPGDITLGGGHMPAVDADGAAEAARTGTLIDARAGERYTGATEPVDPVGGHIPGAVNRPTANNLTGGGAFLPPAALREAFLGLGAAADGAGPVVAYCGSGVTASHTVLALAEAGIDAFLYPGSWSEWSRTERRPVATGPLPG